MDDLLATGGVNITHLKLLVWINGTILYLSILGTMVGAVDLMHKAGAKVLQCIAVVELKDLKGKEKVSENMFSLISL